MTNTVLHITLPAGLALVDGRKLDECVTFDVVSNLDPFYASVDQVKLAGGASLRKLHDLTIASQIYTCSKEASILNLNPPTNPQGNEYTNFINSRNQWVVARSSYDLILSMGDLLAPGSHVLANFSVTKSKGFANEGIAGKITELKDRMKFFEPAVRSGGRTAVGGHPRYTMAAKGVYDWEESNPGRTWNPYSAGANSKLSAPFSPTGGRGKGVNTWCSINYMPFMYTYKMGTFQGGFPMMMSNNFSGIVI